MSDQPSFTAADLAERIGSRVEGDGTRVIRTVATLEEAGPDAISWAANADYLARGSSTQAAAVLVKQDAVPPPGLTVMRVGDPDVVMCEVLRHLAPPPETVTPGIHPNALVSPDARVEGASIAAFAYVGPKAVVGPGTQLHPGVYVGTATTIGRDCVLWPNVVVRERCTIGDRVIIHPNATIGADGFGFLQRKGRNVKIPQIGSVIIEDDVEIGANSAIDRARSGVTRIGRGSKFDNFVQVAHNVEMGEECIIIAQSAIGGSTTLGRRVVMSGHSGISDHVTVGDDVQIAAQSILMRNAEAGAILRGLPATAHHRFLREQASVRKLPKLLERVRELEKRIEEFEKEMPSSGQ